MIPTPTESFDRKSTEDDRRAVIHEIAIRCAGPPKRQTVVGDDADACTSDSPAPPALAAQESNAAAWCSPSVPLQQTGQPIRATSSVPFPGRVHPALQDPSSSANSGASVGRSQAPLALPPVR